jgi:hypothetical protein
MSLAVGEQVLEEARHRGVYFFLPFPDANIYASVCVAEGLEELGVPVFANVNAYPRVGLAGQSYLFNQSPRHPSETAFTIVDAGAIDGPLNLDVTYQLLRTLKTRGAVLCIADKGSEFVEVPADISTFIAHSLRDVQPPGWKIPWAFGLSREIIQQIDAARASALPRRRSFVRNFRPSFNQSVRQALDLSFVKLLEKSFSIDREIDGFGRFQNAYYARLAGSLGCLAYGGTFTENYLRNEWLVREGLRMAPMNGDGPFVARWDSWRFWESLASGCVTVMLDCEAYGLLLPVTPESGTHYVALRFDTPDETVRFLQEADDAELTAIGDVGRQWVLEHYAPKPVALRLLAEMATAYGLA